MRKVIFYFFLSFLFINCSNGTSEIETVNNVSSQTPSLLQNKPSYPLPLFDIRFSPAELVMAEKAFDVFSERCSPLMDEYTEDIESINVLHGFDRRNHGCYDSRCEEFDWDKQIYITIKLKDRLKRIPGILRAWGHTEHYYLGGPKNPGITITKFPELCGVKVIGKNNGDVYISEPRLFFLKNP